MAQKQNKNTDAKYGKFQLNEEPGFVRAERVKGSFKTMSSVPTYVPFSPDEQIVYYKNGATIRIYIYDFTNNVWSYATLT